VTVLEDAEAVLLVVGPDFVERISAIEDSLTNVPEIVSLEPHDRFKHWGAWLAEQPDSPCPAEEVQGDTVVLQIYTSGTTGKPKGVLTSNGGFLSYMESLSAVARFRPESVSLSTLPLFHIGGTGWAMAGLYCGATVVVLREVDPDLILSTIERRKITNLIAVPSVVQMILQSRHLPLTNYESLRYLYYGGGPMSEHILRKALDVFDCEFIQGFGMTECPLISRLEPEEHAPGRALLQSCGRPIPGSTVRLVDPLTGSDVSVGSVGEIWVRSPLQFVGYWKQPDITRQALVDGVWLRTGDAAYRDEAGFLFLKDRLKDMIISGGENIYPAEVENVLISHPDVAECAVIGVPSEKWTETVKALVVLIPGSALRGEAIIKYCKSHLASYKCPTSVDCVSSLPKTPSGKVQKHELRMRYISSAHSD
jgi:long-chain acyl-CoA synthetase